MRASSARLLQVGVVAIAAACGTGGEPAAPSAARGEGPPETPTNPCDQVEPASPLEFGRCELLAALNAAGSTADVRVVMATDPGASAALAAAKVSLNPKAESFAAAQSGATTWVVGVDAVGGMYGAFDLAERIRLSGAGILPLAAPFKGSPRVAFRAANQFLVLPADGETSWWFYDVDFWREYLGLLARARMDVLDLHGMYDLDNTLFPNALLYFASSPSFPSIGIPTAERARNLGMLNIVIQMAAVRGIKVALMTYSAGTDPLGGPTTLDDTSLSLYTREASADLARRAPALWRLGFRIGESGRPAGWYVGSFIAGVKDAGTGVQLSTRTWLSSKPDILDLAAAAGGNLLVEAKFNGEHFAAPYAIEGGAFAGWGSYSYEGYLDPPTPYTFVFQIRAGGTHRIFREASYARIQRTMASLSFSPRVEGFTLEPPHAYFPQRDYYHASSSDSFSPWTFRRDELMYLLFGRLGYDPTIGVHPFRAALAARVGTDALWDAVQAASDIVPWIQTAHTCGPDSRDFAPELEWGGSVGYWASPAAAPPVAHACSHSHQPFDSAAIALPAEAADDLVLGRGTARLSPLEVARLVEIDVMAARAAVGVSIDPANAEARDVSRECQAIADLGEYFAHKLRGASALAVYARTAQSDYLAAARTETQAADAAWLRLGTDTGYIAPFKDLLRMGPLGIPLFHWREEIPWLVDDASSIDAVVTAVAASPPGFQGSVPPAATWLWPTYAPGPGLQSLVATPSDPTAPSWNVLVSFGGPLPATATVSVLWKPFASTVDWTAVPAAGSGSSFAATVVGTGQGGLFAARIDGPPAAAWRYPDPVSGTPYVTLAP